MWTILFVSASLIPTTPSSLAPDVETGSEAMIDQCDVLSSGKCAQLAGMLVANISTSLGIKWHA